jgi:putative FmdB family regulatory protein
MEYFAVPTYSYECGSCAHVFDVFHGISAEPTVKCESCGKKCKRLLGTGAGIIFKGSGFYETDFKEKKGKAPEKAKSESKDKKSTTKAKSDGGSSKKAANS